MRRWAGLGGTSGAVLATVSVPFDDLVDFFFSTITGAVGEESALLLLTAGFRHNNNKKKHRPLAKIFYHRYIFSETHKFHNFTASAFGLSHPLSTSILSTSHAIHSRNQHFIASLIGACIGACALLNFAVFLPVS